MDYDVLIEPESDLMQQGLELTFDGEPIDRLSRTIVALWNSKGDTVRGNDIVAVDPLRIQTSRAGDRVLQARVINRSRREIGLETELDDSGTAALVRFDFLDNRDGGFIEVLHRGRKPKVVGTLRGVRLRSVGPVNLGADARYLLSQPLRKRLGRIKIGPSILIAAACILTLTIVLATEMRLRLGYAKRGLVNFTNYDLETLDGQRRFAEAVSEAGNLSPRPWNPYFFGAFLLIIIFCMCVVFWGNLKTVIPKDLLNETAAPGDQKFVIADTISPKSAEPVSYHRSSKNLAAGNHKPRPK
jgi:hypothetical protein